MSGDVTAAIKADLPHARETWAIGRSVFQTETNATYIDRILAALPSLLAEVERLRAEVRDLSVLADSEAIERTYGRLRDENQRLRAENAVLINMVQAADAEREALHSDETRERIARALARANSTEWDFDPADRDDVYLLHADAVLSVLTAGADQ